MLPNKTVATMLVGLLTIQVLAGLASAQGSLPTPPGPDLVIEDLDIGRSRVVGVPGEVNITIRNRGAADFNGGTGWQIFVGLGGSTNSHCIEPGDNNVAGSPPTVNSPCYIRMVPGQAQSTARCNNALNVPAGQTRCYTLTWTAEPRDQNESALISVEIMNIGNPTPGGDLSNCQGPDGTNCQNNRQPFTGIVIGVLGVRAEPVRQVPETANADKNTAWRTSEIGNEPCPEPPAHVTKGCKVAAGKSIVALYTIQNTGTVDDTYTPSFAPGSNQTLFRAYNISFAPHNFTLGRAQQRDVRVTIVVPENETALKNVNVDVITERVKWTSVRTAAVATDTPTNPRCSGDVYCVNPTLPSFIVDHRRGFNLTSNETWKQVFAGKPSLFNITINNTGNADDTFNVSFVNATRTINDSWTPTISNPGLVPKEGFRNVTVQVTPPLNATNGTYTFEVAVRSRGDLAGTAKCKANEGPGTDLCALTFTAHLAQEWSVSGIGDVPSRVVPGEPVKYNLGIRNGGNGYDNVTLELQSSFTGGAGGWDARLSNRTIALTPFNTTTFSLTVTSPPNTPESVEAAFFVNATSSGPIELPFESRSKATIESKMSILRGPNMRLELPVNSSFIDAGGSQDFSIVVTNVGNVPDNFTVPVPQRPSDWGVTVTPEHLVLQPNEQGTIRVNLRAPSGAEVGERATAIVKVVSTVERTREKQVTLEGRVSGPDLFVESVLVNSTNPYSGDKLDVSVVVGNSGNKAHAQNTTLQVFFVQNGVERRVDEKVYPPLFLGGQRRLVETFSWDTAGIEGPGVLLARIDTENAVSEIDESAASNEKTRAITLRTFDIRLTPAAGLLARPSEKVSYGGAPNVFLLEYRGNQPSEPVTVRFESENGWLSSQADLTLSLPRGTPIPVNVTLDVPAIPGTGKDVLTITVIPALRPSETLRASTTTTILDEENPLVTRILAKPASAKLGDPVTIEVHAEDATGLSAVTAYVTAPTNETTQLVLTRAPDGTWNATRAWTVAGPYRITAEAADEADPPNRNRTRALVGTFVITPGSAPTVALAANQSSTLRTGSPIKLDIRDPLGIGKTTYTIRGVSYDLKGPGFQIDTSTFPEGPIDITVIAENIYGVATTQKFSFTIDNKPPGIKSVEITPDRPRANEDVTFKIATDAKVTAVDVLIKRDGQIVQTLNATRKGAGTFELKFNPPEGDYRIDVTARDNAGNTKIAESAVVFTAKPGSPFDVPGPSLLVALGVALGVALALRRRA